MKLLVVLQNPYKRDRLKNGWNPAAWRKDFESSRTGRRLGIAISPEWEVRFTNANPQLGDSADSEFQPNLQHLRRTIRRVKPDFVLACGLLAEEVCDKVWEGPLLAIPHPAHRLLTNVLLRRANLLMCSWVALNNVFSGFGVPHRTIPRIGLRQKRGSVKIEKLSSHPADSCV